MDEIVKKYNLGYFETDENLKGFAQRYLDVQYSGKYNMFMQAAKVLKEVGMPDDDTALKTYFTFISNYSNIIQDLGLRK